MEGGRVSYAGFLFFTVSQWRAGRIARSTELGVAARRIRKSDASASLVKNKKMFDPASLFPVPATLQLSLDRAAIVSKHTPRGAPRVEIRPRRDLSSTSETGPAREQPLPASPLPSPPPPPLVHLIPAFPDGTRRREYPRPSARESRAANRDVPGIRRVDSFTVRRVIRI